MKEHRHSLTLLFSTAFVTTFLWDMKLLILSQDFLRYISWSGFIERGQIQVTLSVLSVLPNALLCYYHLWIWLCLCKSFRKQKEWGCPWRDLEQKPLLGDALMGRTQTRKAGDRVGDWHPTASLWQRLKTLGWVETRLLAHGQRWEG